jgi:hypothetical protein
MSLPVNSGLITLPPLSKVAAALRIATELLARELTAGTEQPPAWDGFEWCIAKAVATMQGIAPLLERRSRWRDPAAWRRFLSDQRKHVAGRQVRISELLRKIDSAARAENIALLPLKGSALHSIGVYKPGDRPMADIDLLVGSDKLKPTMQLLGDFGFQPGFANWRHQQLELRGGKASTAPFGEHADNPIKIELHTIIREHLPVCEVDITDIIAPGLAHPGLNDYHSLASLMAHLLLHAAANMRARALRLVQLHDIALLSECLAHDDWEELVDGSTNAQGNWWAVAPLILVSRYYPRAIPPFVVAGLERKCPWFLLRIARRQCLTDVSWSNLKVYAFPGIEWSRSPSEALKFISGRIFPSRDVREELRRFAEHEQGESKIPWYGISQGQRILRWVFSRPPRVQTLRVVRAALDQST